MICRRGGAFLRGRIAGFLIVGTSASTAFITGVVPIGAAADNGHDRPGRNAEAPQGKEPRNRSGDKLSVAGSTRNRGYQHTSANTAGGSSNVQNALCRRSRVCNITQHVTITGPRTTARPTPVAPPVSRPVPVPTVTVTVTATPKPAPTPAPAPAPASAAPAPVANPLVAPAAPSPLPAPAETAPCLARPLLRIGTGGPGSGLLGGLLSLSVSAQGLGAGLGTGLKNGAGNSPGNGPGAGAACRVTSG